MKKGLSILINILLFAVIVFLAWQVVKSIQAPIKFNTEQKARETKVVERLIDIRNASSTSVMPKCFTKTPTTSSRPILTL